MSSKGVLFSLKVSRMFHCRFNFAPVRHLSQVYDGFCRLSAAGVVELDVTPGRPSQLSDAVLEVVVNDTVRVLYDGLDGCNWTAGSVADNLAAIGRVEADFWFKRSFNAAFAAHAPAGCRTFPLGLYYCVTPRVPLAWRGGGLRSTGELLRTRLCAFFPPSRFEAPPRLGDEPKILFLTRLWDPQTAPSAALAEEWDQLNSTRIECIRSCRDAFGERFTGGLLADAYALKVAQKWVQPKAMTRRGRYLKRVRESAICVATTGLHGSIGGKFAEYVAASRAVVSEPLTYTVPGDFTEGVNYLCFTGSKELVAQISRLLEERDLLHEMMRSNSRYYNEALRPDRLVANTLRRLSGC